MNLNLTGQSVERNAIAPKLLKLKQLMDERKQIWDRMTEQQRRRWLEVAPQRDPIMDIARDVYRYLRNNFFGAPGGEL